MEMMFGNILVIPVVLKPMLSSVQNLITYLCFKKYLDGFDCVENMDTN